MPDGHKVFLRHWRKEANGSSPKAVIHIIHGMAEHSARYERLAEQLVNQGYHVFAHDHRGHGFTARSKNQLGHFGDRYGWRQVVEDVKVINDLIREVYPTEPLILLGHSMGSFITQKALIKYPKIADGVILSGSTFPNRVLAKSAKMLATLDKRRNGPESRCRTVDFLTFYPYNKAFRPNRTDSDWLSRDPEAVDAYVSDERCGFVCTSQFWIDFSEGLLELYSKKHHSQLPTHIPYMIFSGDRDPVGANGKGVKRLYKKLCGYGANVHFKLYPQGRHEMLNETNKGEVEQDIMAWIKSVVVSKQKRKAVA